MASSKKSAGQIHVGCNFLTPTATTLQTAFNGSRLARAVRWPGSNASRLTLRVTRGVMLPRPRAKAMRHATAPISTLSSAACAALLLAERPSSTRTAFELLAAGIHLALCPKPRVELAPLEYTGFGADSPMRIWVLDRYVLRSRGSSISHEERAFCPWKREKLLLLCGIHCNLATFPFS